MTAGSYLRSLRRGAHVPVPILAMSFGQMVSTMLDIEADRRSVPSAWLPLLAIAYKADVARLSDLFAEQNGILDG
jgi:hypothetical protein